MFESEHLKLHQNFCEDLLETVATCIVTEVPEEVQIKVCALLCHLVDKQKTDNLRWMTQIFFHICHFSECKYKLTFWVRNGTMSLKCSGWGCTP